MHTRTLAAALLLALAPATFSAPVWAQAPADDATTAMARARFKEGVDFYDKGEFEQARASFLQAYALKNHPAVLLNLAWSCLKSGHALEAERYFKKFLAEGKDITDKQRADATDGLTQSRAKLGRIEVVAAAGTEVTVDGDKVGTTPLTDPVAVEAGAHTVKFKGADGTIDTQSVTVLGGEKATVHFGKVAATTPTNPPGPGETTTTTTPPTPPPTEETKPTPEPPKPPAAEQPSGGIPVVRIVPTIVMGVLAVAGFVTGGILAVSKNNAQNQANTTANQIIAHGGGAGSCSAASLVAQPQFAQACNAYLTDNNEVNQDATGANVAIGIGAAMTVGAVVWWFVAPQPNPSTQGITTPVLTPLIGRSGGGLLVGASF